MILRPDHSDRSSASDAERGSRGDDLPRLNLLLSCGSWRSSDAMKQLQSVLGPMGIESHEVAFGRDAEDLIRRMPIHIAVVDLEVPMHANEPAGQPPSGGPRILQMLRRLSPRPPIVVIRPPQPTVRESCRGLTSALKEGAFAVLDRPLQLETMLETMRRVVQRHYQDLWPAG